MGKQELQNLVKIGQLKLELVTQAEFDGMLQYAKNRLADAHNDDLTADSRFDLAYGAAHGYALAALRYHGYRSENRFTVFQTLTHTLGLESAIIRVFSKCHNERNLAEYEGRVEVDDQLLAELIKHTVTLEKLLLALPRPSA